MGVLDDFKSAGLLTKIALALLIVAALFAWIAFTCTGWGKTDNNVAGGYETYYGLWRICTESPYSGTPCAETDGWANDWWAATQAMVSFGFFGINVALLLLILYVFVSSCQKNGEVALAIAIICIVTGVFYLIGVIVFGAKWKEDFQDKENILNNKYELSYAFGLSIVALILEIVAGVLVLVESKKGGTSPSG